jgi:hypothetical protein
VTTTLQRSILSEVEDYETRNGGVPFPMVQVTRGTYGDDRYRAVKALEADGRVRIVHDRWGWSYVSAMRASITTSPHVAHGLPHDVQGSPDYALAWETDAGVQTRLSLENDYQPDYGHRAAFLAQTWASDARYAYQAITGELMPA